MRYELFDGVYKVPESYSRTLDSIVAMQEMPYGYLNNPPPADTQNFDQAALESPVRYKVKNGKCYG